MRTPASTEKPPAGSCTLVNVFSVTGLNVAACQKGAQDALAHVGLHGIDGALIETNCSVKNHTLRCRVGLCSSSIDALRLRHWASNSLKHPIDDTDVKVHIRVQAGAKAVDESDGAQLQVGRVSLCRTGAMALQTLLHHSKENTQRRIECALVALQAVAQPFGHLSSTHWRTGRRGKTWSVRWAAASAMRSVLHEGQTPRPLQEKATKKSSPQSSQRIRAKSLARMPHTRFLRKAFSTYAGGVWWSPWPSNWPALASSS